MENLSDIVDFPMERLHVEYKSALDLTDPLVRAKLARHLCAISNYGGGYVAFGINDDYIPTNIENPYPFTLDDISGISKKYLEPAIQCELRTLTSKLGNKHEMIIVPPHGPTPVCAKANGPEERGKVQGIVAGVHYIRKIGPESSPITTASDWAPVIRRCALHERAAVP